MSVQDDYVFGGELTPQGIARTLFSQPPRPPCTVELGLEGCAPPGATPAQQAQILSEVLMLMFLEGIKVRYGEDKRPESLTPAQIQSLSDHVRSYGFYVIVRTDSLDEPPPVPTAGLQKELKDFHERFYDFDRGMWHELSFDFVPVNNDLPSAGHTMIHKAV